MSLSSQTKLDFLIDFISLSNSLNSSKFEEWFAPFCSFLFFFSKKRNKKKKLKNGKKFYELGNQVFHFSIYFQIYQMVCSIWFFFSKKRKKKVEIN